MSRKNWYKKLKAVGHAISKVVEYFVPAENVENANLIYNYNPSAVMSKRQWVHCILNYESGEILFQVSASTIKESRRRANNRYKLHYKSMREFPEAFWEDLTKPILIGYHEVAK